MAEAGADIVVTDAHHVFDGAAAVITSGMPWVSRRSRITLSVFFVHRRSPSARTARDPVSNQVRSRMRDAADCA